MASLYRNITRPTLTLLKSTMSTSTSVPKPNSIPSLRTPFSSPLLRRSVSEMGSLQSLLPLHTAVSSARLTSCLGVNSKGSNPFCQELGLSVPR